MAHEDLTRRKRVGVAVLNSDSVIEPELSACFRGQPAIHWARVSYPGGVSADSLQLAQASLLDACRSVVAVDPALMIYACTSGSFFAGPAATALLEARIEADTGVPLVTASTAVRYALERLGVRRLGLVTPYSTSITQRLVDFLAAAGVDVVGRLCLFGDRHIDDAQLQATSVSEISAACTAVADDCDAILVSCTGMRLMHAIAELEDKLAVPVLSSNAAISRLIIDRTGQPVSRAADGSYGRLLSLPVPASAGAEA